MSHTTPETNYYCGDKLPGRDGQPVQHAHRGTRIKHTMGPVSIKMYDKVRLILRIETTVVNVSFFKHYREVEHKDGSSSIAWAQMKKTIYNLAPLREVLLAANRRYLEFISAIEDDKAGIDKLNRISQPAEENDRTYPGFNFFDPQDEELFRSLGSGEFNISVSEQGPPPAVAGHKQRPNLAHDETPANPWLDQEDRPHLQVLPHRARQTGITLGLKLKQLYIIPALAAQPIR